ncbi:MAG: hypothetical protein LBU51_02595 [Bacteroidales bacterium]|nr:hypothetical protein [Bacteroidales bacterium]
MKLPKKTKSVQNIEPKLEKFISNYQSKGYITFSIDTLLETKDTIKIVVFQGNQYDLEEVPYLKKTNYIEKTLSQLENSGYPFAQISLDSVEILPHKINAKLKIEKNSFITFDSIVLKGDAKLSKSYLYPYLRLRRKKTYNESIIKTVPNRIAELPFVMEIQPSGVEFVEDKAHLYLFLNKVRTNRFDGFIGLVPADEQSGKVTLNGELNLNFNNLFTLGEHISLLWRAPDRYSQYLHVNADFKYLLWTPFGIAADFILDKRDTSYLNMNYLIGIQYSFIGNNAIKLFFDYTTSSMLGNSANSVISTSLPSSDFKKSMYGISLFFSKLDHLFNPRKGFAFSLLGSAGTLNVLKNITLDASIYENIPTSSLRYTMSGDFKLFIPLHKRFVLLTQAVGGYYYGNHLFNNELMKIGGIHSLRGFDENSIDVSSFLTGLVELRFQFERRSYLNAFFNGGWYERVVVNNFTTDTPYGFGLGISIDAKIGMFYLMYALGHQYNNPISFKSGKIHFGIELGF